jgi:hypothetical protein
MADAVNLHAQAVNHHQNPATGRCRNLEIYARIRQYLATVAEFGLDLA